jgi:uncharacterized protein
MRDPSLSGPVDPQERATLPALPRPLRWIGRPEAWAPTADDGLTIRAGARTDWFIDPEHGTVTLTAPALAMPVQGPWMLSVRASAEHRARFDAAVLVVHVSERVWAKLCLERSADGLVRIVSVVTKGIDSDDCDSVVVPSGVAHLRVSRLGRAYAFHWSEDGRRWTMVRYFALDDADGAAVGFLAQSPTGDGCTALFDQIRFRAATLGDVRSGE